ncbi:MAG: winged helix-turn-helix transcriptional regulator [Chloroflexi bacterium]|nr:winged helix-turn-helix transcriptional regulator [Chloroflexota bacterium]
MLTGRKEKQQELPGESARSCCSVAPLPVVKSKDTALAVKRLSALSDPTRLAIVQMLAVLDEPLCVCDIVAQFQLGQPTISHHLRVLRDAGLVLWEKRGLWVYYSLDRRHLEQLTAFLQSVLPERTASA